MVKVAHALASLYSAEASSGLALTEYKKLLTNIARSLAIDAIEAAAGGTHARSSASKVESAKALLGQGSSLQAAGDYRGAVARFHHALQRVQGVK